MKPLMQQTRQNQFQLARTPATFKKTARFHGPTFEGTHSGITQTTLGLNTFGSANKKFEISAQPLEYS
jgi:hypothetical protein